MTGNLYISYWATSAPGPDLPTAELPPEADVVVVGAGIAGVTTAYLLTQAGRSVVLLEADRLVRGTTAGTTAKIAGQHGPKYATLRSSHGPEAAKTYAAGQSAALEWIAAEADRLKADCDFERRDAIMYTTDAGRRSKLKEEAEAATEAGLPMTYDSGDIGLPFPVAAAVRCPGQAQFHPRKFLFALVEQAMQDGCVVAENCRVTGVDNGDPITVTSTLGTIRARDVVIATHYPILDRGLFFARLDPVHDLVVAAPVEQPLPAMYLDLAGGHSMRTAPMPDGRHLMIVLGEHHRPGTGDTAGRYRALTAWAAEELGMPEPTHSWSAHDVSTADGVPYIGRYHPGTQHLWVATGFGQWGITGGTAAALLLRDLITGAGSEWTGLYDPNRIPPVRSIPELASANLTVARHLAGDHLKAFSGPDLDELAPGDHAVTRAGSRMVAAYRDSDGELHAVSARCTHLGCLVQFNNAERTWDCPCHASRFGLDGSVLHGPANRPLDRVKPE